MSIYSRIFQELRLLADPIQEKHLKRFFKTAPGDYGYGDEFLGVRVPVTRKIAKEYRKEVELEDVEQLIQSRYHEIRLAGFLLLIEIYKRYKKRKDEESARAAVDFYIAHLDRGNNWDLVDLVAPKILGDWLSSHPDERGLLDELAAMNDKLWHQRTAVVSNWTIIQNGEYDDTYRIARKLLMHPHDLIHKAVGWMLRETGKRGNPEGLKMFLDEHAAHMPRTMLRYAIEQLPNEMRKHYLSIPRKQL